MSEVLSPTARVRLEIQGFGHVPDDLLIQAGLWLRLPFMVYAFLGLLGTIFLSPWLLWVMVPLGAAGAAYPVHPVDRVYNRWFRTVTGTGSLPPRAAPSRFAHGMLAACFLVAGLGFWEEIETIGYAAGWTATGLTVLTSATNICVPSIVYRGIFGFSKGTAEWRRSPELRHDARASQRD
jgi:hypothetical protein